ncbi:4-hydroxy-tetrahydrodipicolinate reductase [Arachidicoccus terrestris]|uniref:4-hydroxy-tetrahydrodipicolinate reductase n=1 Tax=Arachidicoccus terrestris TaxID=2875539 RepID=UPI001CC4AF20|nr:4-hydroxy-tetrahydrodipicolinate reductase [Arachidicoccus terrestris]UAY54997.1 4-hydroxy-tetrahydrodipicolinate reductase [Arachidicoccus terrestris]
MKIALIGYGKMGHAIEEIAVAKGHEIVLKINIDNTEEFTSQSIKQADVAIEFTGPDTALGNILKCIENGVPVVSGSTGWLDKWSEVEGAVKENEAAFLYSSNYSIGVNLFFEVNKYLARLMKDYPDYDVEMEEIHHTQKKDAPSGTAISLAEQILENLPRKKGWINEAAHNAEELAIISKRIDPAPGTHVVTYKSDIDDIEIKHTAHNRKGFASGAVVAAEFLENRKGIYSMRDVLFGG